MSVPQHILEAEKKMEESIKALQSENTAEEATPAEEPAAQEDKAEEPNGPGFEESAPEGDSKDADPEEELRKARHKVSVLEGKLKSLDTKELQSRLSRIEAERDQYKQAADALFAELRELKLQKESAPPPKTESADLTEEQRELYGDMIPVMTAVVNKALAEKGVEPVKASRLEDIGRQVQQVRAQVQQDKQQNAQMTFFSKVDSLVPDRESIEKSPEFASFMEETDWKTGLRNQDLLIARGRALDAEGAVAFYREFKKFLGKEDGDEPKRDPREKFLSPGKSRAGAPVSRKGPLTSAEAGRLIAEAKALVGKGDHEGAEKINNELLKRMAAAK